MPDSPDAIVLREVRSLGVSDPLHATVETVKTVLGAYFTGRALNEQSFHRYLHLLNPSLEVLMEGFRAFSTQQTGLSHKAQDSIRLGIETLGARLREPNLSEQEARELRWMIVELVQQARLESDQQRLVSLGFATLATSAFLAAVTGVLAVLEARRGGGGFFSRRPQLGSGGSGPGRLLLK
jgi:hypothetical protein